MHAVRGGSLDLASKVHYLLNPVTLSSETLKPLNPTGPTITLKPFSWV